MMKKFLASLLALAVTAAVSRAHFVWILPPAPDAATPVVRVVFSDQLAPDDPKLLDKIKQTELFVYDKDGKPTALKMSKGKDAWEAKVPGADVQVVGAACAYGVVDRGG